MATYEIIFRNATANDSSAISGGQNLSGVAKPSATSEGESAADGLSLAGVGKAASALGIAAMGKQIFGYEVSRIGIETGDYQLQQEIQGWTSLATKVVGIGAAFAVNPLLGFTALASTAISVGQQLRTFNYEKDMEDIALQQARLRGGVSLNASRRLIE